MMDAIDCPACGQNADACRCPGGPPAPAPADTAEGHPTPADERSVARTRFPGGSQRQLDQIVLAADAARRACVRLAARAQARAAPTIFDWPKAQADVADLTRCAQHLAALTGVAPAAFASMQVLADRWVAERTYYQGEIARLRAKLDRVQAALINTRTP